jgi:predicted ATPase/DNA-binding CsgD family transcriptional regulator
MGQGRDNLPAEVTRFIGRRRELPAIGEAIERHRLVTLRGAGGVGKTRLALHVAAGRRDSFTDGCWLVQLSPLQAPELLARTVSEALGLPDEAAGDAPQVLAQNLAERELLLVLDTCEHLTEACAELAALLLPAAPGLRILATSRSPLGLRDEHSLLIAPLELPTADDATAARADAVTLFVDRAQAAVPGFALTSENTPAVAELCRRLDGIPLALELAAVRLRGMPVEELLARLSDRFRVLGTARTSTDRHRTLRAAVSWSYELCTPAEQKLWAELSVFPGGFGLAAAEHVCGPGTGETLRRLTAKSVVQFSPGGATPRTPRGMPDGKASISGMQASSGGAQYPLGTPQTASPLGTPQTPVARTPRGMPDEKALISDIQGVADDRYQMLDTMREFGAELLAAAGAAEAARVRARHRDYYLGLAERAAAGSMTAEQTAWLTRLGTETANLRVALDFSCTARLPPGGATPRTPRGTPDEKANISDMQSSPVTLSSPSKQGEVPDGLRMTRPLLPYWLMTGQFTEGRRWHDLALSVAPASSDNAWALFGAGVLAVQQGDFATGGPLLARATEMAGANADEDLAAHVTDARGMLAFYSGDLVTAQGEFEAALAVYERAGFPDPTALVTYGRLASVCLVTFELDRAVKLCEECIRRCDELGEQWARGTALWVRGGARWLSGDNAAAIEDALACLRIKESLGDLHTIAMSFDLLSVCLVATGDFERAAVLYGAGMRLWTLLNAPVLMGPAYAELRKSGADTARNSLGEERFDALTRHGHAMSLPVAVAVAKGEAPAAPPAGSAAPGTAGQSLTRREKEIADLVADGLGNREIAERLFLSKRTVDSHLEHIFAKLGFSSRTQLAAWVLAP